MAAETCDCYWKKSYQSLYDSVAAIENRAAIAEAERDKWKRRAHEAVGLTAAQRSEICSDMLYAEVAAARMPRVANAAPEPNPTSRRVEQIAAYLAALLAVTATDEELPESVRRAFREMSKRLRNELTTKSLKS